MPGRMGRPVDRPRPLPRHQCEHAQRGGLPGCRGCHRRPDVPRQSLAIAERVVGWARQSSLADSRALRRVLAARPGVQCRPRGRPLQAVRCHGRARARWSRLLLDIHASLPEAPSWLVSRRRGDLRPGRRRRMERRRSTGLRLHHRLDRNPCRTYPDALGRRRGHRRRIRAFPGHRETDSTPHTTPRGGTTPRST